MTRKTFYQNKLFVGLSKSNEKSVSQIVLKMVEELGEVTEGIMDNQNNILEELVDFQMVAESLIVKINGDKSTTQDISGDLFKLVVGVGLVSESTLSEMNASGMSYKNKDSSELESAILNVIHISEHIFKQLGGTAEMKGAILQEKCEKWAKVTNYLG